MSENVKKYRFPEPGTFQEADERMTQLHMDALLIEGQLSDHNRLTVSGERMDEHAYWTWHRSATFALAMKRSEMTFLKKWKASKEDRLKTLVVAQEYRIDAKDPNALVSAAYALLKRLYRDGAAFTAREMKLMDGMAMYVREHGVMASDTVDGGVA